MPTLVTTRAGRPVQMPAVTPKSDDAELREAQRRLVRHLAAVCGWDPTQLARAAGLAASTINRFLNSKEVTHTLSARTLDKIINACEERLSQLAEEITDDATKQALLARVASIGDLKISRWSELLKDIQGKLVNRGVRLDAIQVVGAVQAGRWVEAVRWPYVDQYTIQSPVDDRYPGIPREGLEVRGPSMNLLYPEGTVVIVVSLIAIDRDPTPGQKVVVQRRRRDGTVEATVKEFQKDEAGKVWLWPRSNHPEHQQPIDLTPSGEIEEIQITSLVVGSYRRE